jgi:hypothetical protein
MIYQFGIKRGDFGGIEYIWSEIFGGNKSHENNPNFYLIDLVYDSRLFDYTSSQTHFLSKLLHYFHRGKSSPKIHATSAIFKKENNFPTGENSPNLVTLFGSEILYV